MCLSLWCRHEEAKFEFIRLYLRTVWKEVHSQYRANPQSTSEINFSSQPHYLLLDHLHIYEIEFCTGIPRRETQPRKFSEMVGISFCDPQLFGGISVLLYFCNSVIFTYVEVFLICGVVGLPVK